MRRARSVAGDVPSVVAELVERLGGADGGTLVYFADPRYDFRSLAAGLHAAFGGTTIGCTTAGEISSEDGHCEGGVVATLIEPAGFEVRARLVREASGFNPFRAEEEIRPLLEPAGDSGRFGLVLIDGLSVAEEQVAASLSPVFGRVPFVGGSAGDGLRFDRTFVGCNGEAATDAAVVAVAHTRRPFHILHGHHFTATETRLVITEADAARRRVVEVNGLPAAEGYADAVGLRVDELSPQVFAAHPVLLSIGGRFYVRSIQKVNEDGSLTFFCAIDEGLVLRVARAHDLVATLSAELEAARTELGEVELVLAFDCILRRLELISRDRRGDASAVLAGTPTVGFSTYGEQFNGLHLNQTLTGVAIGRAA